MPKFRKKPIVIEAEQFIPPSSDAGFAPKDIYIDKKSSTGFSIDTLEGKHEVTAGDWIITGIKGEKYPCKPDIFEATYQLISENDMQSPPPLFIQEHGEYIIREIPNRALIAFKKNITGYFYSIPYTQNLTDALKEIKEIIAKPSAE